MTPWTVLAGALIVGVASVAILNRERIAERMQKVSSRKYGKLGDRVTSNITTAHIVFWIIGIAGVLLVNLIVANVVGAP
jgi:hypothetical protein